MQKYQRIRLVLLIIALRVCRKIQRRNFHYVINLKFG